MSKANIKQEDELIIDKILSRDFCCADQSKICEAATNFNMKIKSDGKLKTKYRLYKFEKSKNTKPFPFFVDEQGLNKMCDYILFVEHDETISALAIEIKSGGKGSKSASPQLCAAKDFIRFIIKRGKAVGLIDIKLKHKIERISIRQREERNREKTRRQVYNDISPKRDDNGIISYEVSKKSFLIKKFLEIPS